MSADSRKCELGVQSDSAAEWGSALRAVCHGVAGDHDDVVVVVAAD